MCKNCLPYRTQGAADYEHATSEVAATGQLASSFQTPMSRRQLLQAAGGGLAAALTAGMLDWNAALGAANQLPYVVLIVLDGARPDYLGTPGIPHVSSLIRNGMQYTNAFAGILESETPSGHVSIGTGSDPARTGIPSFWWATNQNTVFSLFSPAKVRAGDMEKIIRQARVPTLAGMVHAKSRQAKVVALSGSKYYAADAIGGPDADITMYFQSTAAGQFVPTYIPGHPPPAGLLNASHLMTKTAHMPLGTQNRLAMQLAVDTFNRVRQQVTLINLPDFDWPLGHVDGGNRDPQAVTTLMQGFDRDLGMLQDTYRKAGVLDRTLFVLMADHGMMPLTHTISQSDITTAVAKAGTSLVSQTYTSAVYLWLKQESRAPAVAQNLARLNNPAIQSVYARIKTAKGYSYTRISSAKLLRAAGTEGANQYLLNSFNGSNAPDIVIALTEGSGCEPGGQAKWKADHGGTSWQAQHIPLILSGAGIRSGQTSSYPARLIDIAPTVLQVMGASHKGMQGIPLADALQAPPSWTLQWQKTASKRLMPVVTALQQQSHLELTSR
ncbi:MAG TPA: alkaline phosphatase family protein [Chloroflexota bacterium]|nr:alkaline phosphatase family protein [Chloroflexota bacterium]